MTQKLLSVIIPAYNVANYIVECVDSLLTQIPAPNELIIVNDGSTDDTLARVEQPTCDESRVRSGDDFQWRIGHARDYGIAMAEGNSSSFAATRMMLFVKGFMTSCRQPLNATPSWNCSALTR